MRALIYIFCVVLIVIAPGPGSAHTLGIDKAELVEKSDGTYALISRVPDRLAHLITTPQLPERCTLRGNPAGERGVYEVRFIFACSTPLNAGDVINLPWQREGAMLTARWHDAEPVTRFAGREGSTIPLVLSQYLAGSGSTAAAATRYTVLGFEHILDGIDHLLFILGLLLLVRGPWMLVKTITAFTVAHSITLALAVLGVVNIPSAPVEAAIALSIVFLAVEIVNARRQRFGLAYRKPWLVAFGFGLLHGLGFAGALSQIGLPPQEVPVALVFFNVGVEIGQLVFVAGILVAHWIWLRLPVRLPQWAELVPVYVLGTIATYWFFERTSAIFVPA